MNLNEQEKEELFADFMLRMAEMDKADKGVSSAKNRSAMKNLHTYYTELVGLDHRYGEGKTEKNAWLYRQYDGWWYFAADGMYDAYLALRKAIPCIVGAKRALNGTRPMTKSEGYKKQYVLDPEKDREEADKIGKALIDTMVAYLKEGSKDEGRDHKD